MFARIDTIAVVGCSRNNQKPAHGVPLYMQDLGYHIIPVNPYADRILGETAYSSLHEANEDYNIDLVDVFRPAEEVPDIADQVLDIGPDYFWLQLGIRHDETLKSLHEADIIPFQDLCLKIEYRKRFSDQSREEWITENDQS